MIRWALLVAVALLAVVLGVAFGPIPISVPDLLSALLGEGDPTTVAIVRLLRLPRTLLAFVVGGCLAVTGGVLQSLVRNPLADPYLLGLSGGAGVGAVMAIAFHLGGTWGVPIFAFGGALLAIALVYRLALVTGSILDPRILLLAGVVVSAFSGAILGAMVSISPAPELRNAMLWLLGGFDAASWSALVVFGGYAIAPMIFLIGHARTLDLMSLGREPAQYLGVDVDRAQKGLYIAASLVTAAAVAVSGVIGFVGLVVPHIIRMVWGHTHAVLLPAAFLLGGALLATADTVARTAFAPREMPVGVVTALIGVPVFAMLLRRWTP